MCSINPFRKGGQKYQSALLHTTQIKVAGWWQKNYFKIVFLLYVGYCYSPLTTPMKYRINQKPSRPYFYIYNTPNLRSHYGTLDNTIVAIKTH